MLETVKAIQITFTLLLFLLFSLFLEFFPVETEVKRNLRIKQAHVFGKKLLEILGVTVNLSSHNPLVSLQGQLVVSNHLSYLDVVALAAVFPSVFITSREVESSFFLGFLSKSAGALFVERRKRFQLQTEIEQIEKVLEAGDSVTVFPEATTSSGEEVLPFKPAFFDAAIRAKRAVLPVCINYRKVNRVPISASWKEHLFYFGEMKFFPHLKKLLSLQSVEMDITFLEPITVDLHSDRKELSLLSHSKIVSHYAPVV